MAPNQQDDDVDQRSSTLKAGMALANAPPGEEVCISGLAGMFPDSDNVNHFRDNLFSKYDMVTEDNRRWNIIHPEIPKRTGKLNNIDKFDAAFFGVHYKQAHSMDPMCRVLLEKSYEAIVDAGINPIELKGTNTGVYIGACFSETEKTWFYEKLQPYGYGLTGCSRAMLANRISYFLGVNGPSYTVDSACSSSLYALEHAYKDIRDGVCDQAIVGGSNLCLHPYLSLQFSRLGVLSPQGMCKSFDCQANGYTRSEAICAIFLQKTRDCKRIYATVVHAKTNCDGYKEQGITYPSGKMQQKLLHEFYEECQVDPKDMAWIEAHGTGTRVGDPEELSALDAVFCTGRATPLPIGSVKSNIGHSEPASGLCSVSKVIIAMETNMIPPNLHYSHPREGVQALADGRLQVVTEPQPWDGGYVGVNSFGFGGANAHVLLRWNAKSKINGGAPKDVIPRLITISSRTEKGVNQILDDLARRPVDTEHVRLLHDIHSVSTPGHLYRGFILFLPHKPIRHVSFQECNIEKRPVWFLFSGLDSHWSGMGTSLLNIPAFSSVIDRAQSVLHAKGLDLRHIFTQSKMEDIVHANVAVTAMQLGLVNVLETVGIHPEGVVGHSIGELAAGYADNCFTIEEAILASYYRALALQETEFIKGSMALIDLGSDAIKGMLPPEIEVACHNGSNSCTVSGPSQSIATLVETLAASNVTAQELRCGQVAAHSRYVASVGPTVMKYFKKVIPTPKTRSERWISSSVTESKWSSHLGRLASAEYLTNNLLSPVLFDDAMKHVPSNAIIVEVSPDSSLLRVIGKHGSHVALMTQQEGGMESVLTAIGQLYEEGCVPQLASLYPAVAYPVSRGTPMISPLIGWDHSLDWYVTTFKTDESYKKGERDVTIKVANEDMTFYTGHVIDGRNLFPATGYLVLVWETLGQMCDHSISEIAVVFENVRFHRATNLPKEGTVAFVVMVQKATGNFEVVEGGAAIVTGRIFISKDISSEMVTLDPPQVDRSAGLIEHTAKDLYKELRLRGYNYSGLFRSIVSSDSQGKTGKILWLDNWIAFMDNMLQMQIMMEDTRGLFVPTSIDKLCIDPFRHLMMVHDKQGDVVEKDLNPNPQVDVVFDVYVHKEVRIIQSGGIEIRGLNAAAINRRKPLGDPVLEKYQFVPNSNESPVLDATLDMNEILRIFVHIGLENQLIIKIKAVEVVDDQTDPLKPLIAETLAAILGDWPLIQADISVLCSPGNPLTADLGAGVTVVEDGKLSGEKNCMFVVGTNILARQEVLQTALSCISGNGYLITREKLEQSTELEEFSVVNEYCLSDEKIVLLKKAFAVVDPLVLKVTSQDYGWMSELKTEMKKEKSVQRVLLVAQGEPMSGIIGLFNCIRKEPGGENTRCYFILDESAPVFDPELPLYKNQLQKDVALNVYKDGRWGGYRHLALEECEYVVAKHAYVNITVRGDLSSFRWIEGPLDPLTYVAKPKQQLVQVYMSALNFRDVMTATGKIAAEVIAKGRLNQDCVQGLEFAGRTPDGKRVMGKITSGAMATMLVADTDLLWDIPDEWTMEDAATVPVVYGTAYYAMLLIGHMKKGDTILIHAGSGGVGQAAIQIALFEGCTVYTTVGTQEKRDFIKKRFPQLTDRHIGNSRDTSFEQLVMTETEGRGVDMVLNSLSEEKLRASVRCLAVGGRFLEIGKFDLANNNLLGMETFLRETSFHGVMLDNLFHASSEMKKPLYDILCKGIREGAVKPLSRTVFSEGEVEQAFRFMATGKHIGKVLLKIRPEEEELHIIPVTIPKPAMPRYLCNPQQTYIIVGGLGGFGLELADWLVLRGARKLMLTSRTGLKTGYQSARLRVWKGYGVDTRISTDDITTEEGVIDLLAQANKFGPVAAIFNLAVVLVDAFFENQTADNFVKSFGPKATATDHLDRLSRRLCPHLQQFVVFSSVSCGRGNAGQTNYGMANSVMERICERRVREGYPGLAVQWGAVGEVGLVAEMQDEQHEVVIGGTLQQRISSCLQVLDGFLRQSNPVVASMVVAEKKAGSGGAGNIVDCVVNILGLRDLKTVSLHSTLAELGMDSMMAVEIKQTLEREFEVFLSPQDIRGLTFAKLIDLANSDPEAHKKADSELNMDGIEFLIRAIGDEAAASHVLVPLPSLVGENETSANLPVMFMVPGIEGMASVLEPLAKNLKSPVIGLQLGYNLMKESTAKEMARVLLPLVLERIPAGAPYNLIGYSFGGLVALELALFLENEGHPGKLFVVDGTPEFLRQICHSQLVDGSENKLQTSLLMRILTYLKTQDAAITDQIASDLLKLTTWDDKLNLFLSLVPESEHSLPFRKRMATSTYARIQATLGFNWPDHAKIKANVTLIRPSVMTAQSAPDQGMSKYCLSPVDVHLVEGNHISILESAHVANIINSQVTDYLQKHEDSKKIITGKVTQVPQLFRGIGSSKKVY